MTPTHPRNDIPSGSRRQERRTNMSFAEREAGGSSSAARPFVPQTLSHQMGKNDVLEGDMFDTVHYPETPYGGPHTSHNNPLYGKEVPIYMPYASPVHPTQMFMQPYYGPPRY